MKKLPFLFLMIVCSCTPTMTDKETTKVATEKDKEVVLHQGQKLQVKLKARFGTGYSWKLTNNIEVVESIEENKDDKDKTGGWTIQVFELQTKKDVKLEFVYRNVEKTTKKFILDVIVKRGE